MRLLLFVGLLSAGLLTDVRAQTPGPDHSRIEAGVSAHTSYENLGAAGAHVTGYAQIAIGLPIRLGRVWAIRPEALYLQGVAGAQELPGGTPGVDDCRSARCRYLPNSGFGVGLQMRRRLGGGRYLGIRSAVMGAETDSGGGYFGVLAGTPILAAGQTQVSLEGQVHARTVGGKLRPMVGLGLRTGL